MKGRLFVGFVSLLLGGCYSGIDPDADSAGDGDPSGGPASDGSSADGGETEGETDTSNNDGGDPPPEGAVAEQPLTRLSSTEYRSTIEDLLGPTLTETVAIELTAVPVDTRVHLGLDPADSGHLDAYAAVAQKVAATLIAEPARFADIGAPCLADAGADQACVRQGIVDFGLRAFRRPLTDEEIDDLLAFYAEPDDHFEGLQRVFTRMLLAPQLLFHLEIDGEEVDSDLRLDDYAVASRLSYRLLGTMPTPELFAAAAAGELQTAAELQTQVDTILQDPRAQAYVLRLFEAWMEVEAFPILGANDPFLEGGDPAEIRDGALAEFAAFVDDQVWSEGVSFGELVTRGLFQQPAAVARGTHQTAPILRGVSMLRNVLCSELPSPDADVVNSRLEELDELDPAQITLRDIIDVITGDDACQSCHSLINPLTYTLGDLDPLGRKRNTETVYDGDGSILAEHPVDATAQVTLPGMPPQTISGSDELVAKIAELPQAQRCFAERIYAHTRLRPPDDTDEDALEDLSERVAADDASVADVFTAHAADERTLWRRLGD